MIENRKARRRQKALQRRHEKRAARGRLSFCGAVLASASLGILAGADPNQAQAQVVLNPPGTIPAQCTVTGGTAVCEGNLSAGLDADGPPLNNLTIQNLDAAIAPAATIRGISVETTSGNDVLLSVDAGAFGVITQGADADGISLINPGSGNITVNSVGNIDTQASTNGLGIEVRHVGQGDVTITSTGDITSDDDAIGVSANSGFAGVGGRLIVRSVGNLTSNGDEGIDVTNRSGDAFIYSRGTITADRTGIDISVLDGGSISVDSHGNITATRGDGIDALSGSGDVTVQSTGNITANDSGIDAATGTGGTGDITIVSVGNVTAATRDGIDSALNGSGLASITVTGDVQTTAAGFAGIYVYGSTAAAGSTITINVGSTVTGGAGSGDGVRFAGGGTNQLINWGTIQSVGGSAVEGGPGGFPTISGREQVFNFGTLNGAINLGSNDDLVVLDATGTITTATFDGGADTDTLRLNSATVASNAIDGSQITNFEILEKSGSSIWTLNGTANFSQSAEILGGTLVVTGTLVTPVLTNTSGTLDAGGVTIVGTAAVTGNFVQAVGGTLGVDIDPTAGTADSVAVTGTANLAGLVQPVLINPAFGAQSHTILTAAGGTTNNGLGLLASPALQASLSFPNANDVVLNYSIDFSAGGLNPNQTALAGSLNSAFGAGIGGLEPVLTPLLNNVFTIGDYRNALNQLLPEVVLNTETATLFSSEDFVENLFSCRLAGDNHTALSEGECYWARPQGRFLDRDSDANAIGFDETSGGLAAGAQVAVAPNWFAGFALGYERASLDTDTGAETDSNRLSGGLSLKYQAGSFLLGAAISGGVSGNDTQRAISFGGFSGMAESNYAIKTLTGQARAAYVFQLRDWFAKPLIDVTATYLSRDGVTETGAGAANLALAGSDDTFFSVTPALEVGGDFAVSETSVIRPYVRAGVSFYTDSDHGLTASFVNTPAGTNAFSITSDFDDVFADVAAGATAFFDNGSSLGLAYEGLISSDTQQHGISVKGTWRF